MTGEHPRSVLVEITPDNQAKRQRFQLGTADRQCFAVETEVCRVFFLLGGLPVPRTWPWRGGGRPAAGAGADSIKLSPCIL